MSSSLEHGGAPHLLLEPSVTMHEEPGEVFLNSEPPRNNFYNNGDIPAQISITKIPSNANNSSINSSSVSPRGSYKGSPRGGEGGLAGIVPRGLRPVQIRPPPLLRGGAPGIPPPPRLQFAGIPSNIRPVHRGGNPILGMMNVAKKVGNTPRFSSRGPSPRCKQLPSATPPSFPHPGVVPGIKNVSPVSLHPSRPPPPMMRPGYRPVNVRMRGRPPLIKRSQPQKPPPPTSKPENEGGLLKIEVVDPVPPEVVKVHSIDVKTEEVHRKAEETHHPLSEVVADEEAVPSEAGEKNSPSPISHDKEAPNIISTEQSSDPEVSFSKESQPQRKKLRLGSTEVKEKKEEGGPSPKPVSGPLVSEDKVEVDEDKGATKFRFVRRADGKGFVKKSVKSSAASGGPSSALSARSKAYSSAVLKGIRKKKKKPFKGINYRFDGSIQKKKKSYFNSSNSFKDDDDTSSIRSEMDDSNEHDVLTYLGIQRKDSSDSKSSITEDNFSKGEKVLSGPKARKSFGGPGGGSTSIKRSLEEASPLSNGVPKKTRTYSSPRVGQFFPLPSSHPVSAPANCHNNSSCNSSSTTSVSATASDEDALKEDLEEEEEDEEEEMALGLGKANYICECEKSIDDLLLRRNSSTLCRAIESVGGSRVGCRNPIQSFNQLRPDVKLPKKVFCEIHTERLRAHQACGFCGEFCSHGMFYLCRPNKRYAPHVFHQGCYNRAKLKACCHCGSTESPAVVQMTLKMDRAPIQLLRSVSKMSFPAGKKGKGASADGPEEEEVVKYKMPNGKVISSHGLPLGLGNSVLLKVLSELEDKAAPKHLTRNMYFPTKSGDAVKILQLLSQGYSPNQKFAEFNNGSPLHLSASEGHVLNCHIFTQSGTELDSFDDSGNTPIHLAAIKGRTEVLRYLLQAGADMGLRGEDGMTALHLAAQNGHLDCVKIILAQHNLPRNFLNLQDDGGWTPLVWACENKHEKIIKYLLMRGSNPLIVDAEGNIALHWASLSGSRTTCEVLMDYGCDVNARNSNGDAPIHIALRQDHYECAVLLLMRGANTNLKNKNGQLPVDCMSKDAKCATIMKLSTKLNAMMTSTKVHVHERIVTNDVSKGKENCPIQCINAVDEEGAPRDYVYVRNNVVTSDVPIDRNHASLQHCKCEDVCSSEDSCNCSKLSVKSWYDLEGKLKSSFDYKEPPMIFECNDLCNCNVATCHNRVIQHGVTSRMIVFRTQNMGWGVRALKDISKGTFVCEYVGEIISDSEADTREDSYLFDLDYREGETYCIDANRFGNIARFINHSCNPNLTPVKVFAEHQDLRFPHIALFANRDIPKGMELGFDYGEKFWVIKHRAFTCHCGSEACHYNSSSIQAFLKDYYQRFPGETPEGGGPGDSETQKKDDDETTASSGEVRVKNEDEGTSGTKKLVEEKEVPAPSAEPPPPPPLANGVRPRRSLKGGESTSSPSPSPTPPPPSK